MLARSWFLLAGAVFAASFLMVSSVTAQMSTQPPDCVCSAGVNVGSEAKPVTIRHCQCGVVSCVVVVESGQLQCTR